MWRIPHSRKFGINRSEKKLYLLSFTQEIFFKFSVAHCITSAVDGRLYNLAEYFVGAGKYNSDYDSPLDKYAQHRIVIDAKIPNTYRGSLTEYASDIAVLFVNEPFDISGIVRLVCIDWSPSNENDIFATEAIGYVSSRLLEYIYYCYCVCIP